MRKQTKGKGRPAKGTYGRVYQFKITLMGSEPPIWRQIQVPETYSFWDLHVALQDAMGWSDSHPHSFEMMDSSTHERIEMGIPDEDGSEDGRVHAEWKKMVADLFTLENTDAFYTYDFGDDWRHEVELEGILPREEDTSYPRCIAGERACPPEDCGGMLGYLNMLKVIADKEHKERKNTMEWLGGQFDPERFDAKAVKFDDPKKRWKTAFG